MKKVLLVLLFVPLVCFGQNTSYKNNLSKELLNLINQDTYSSNYFMNEMNDWSNNFHKNIESKSLRKKYLKELNTDLKLKLEELYMKKKTMALEMEKLLNQSISKGYGNETEIKYGLNSLLTFYESWYKNQLKFITEYFPSYAAIFDNCEFQYNPNSSSEMFLFYTDICLNNYNSKITEAYELINKDEILKKELKKGIAKFV